MLLEKKALMFREEVFATMSIAMDACCPSDCAIIRFWSLHNVTSHGCAHFQKLIGSKRLAMCWYSVESFRDLGHACMISLTGKSWSCTSSTLIALSTISTATIWLNTNGFIDHGSFLTALTECIDDSKRCLRMG